MDLFTIANIQKLNHNLKALEAVWDYAYDKVGYLGTNMYQLIVVMNVAMKEILKQLLKRIYMSTLW